MRKPRLKILALGFSAALLGISARAEKDSKGAADLSAPPASKDMPVTPAPVITPTPPPGHDCITLDDFSESTEGAFPKNWKSRYDHNQKEAEDKKLWVVVKDGDRRSLHGIYGTHTITIVRQIDKWDMANYPFLEWDWKATKLPTGGDESSSSKNDTAASIYLIWEESWPMKGSFLRFTWSSTLPIGKILSHRLGYEKVVVSESGTAKLNTWKHERANIRELAQKELKKPLNKSPVGLALNTDADGTRSSAEAYYANFRLCK